MAIPERQRASVTRQLTEYCAPHPRAEVRRVLRYGFEFASSHVILFEERPHFERSSEWTRLDIAKFRWVAARGEWQLYCQFRDLKWRAYRPRPSARTFGALLREVEADRTGIFWG
jgi:hypothetical protein